MITHDAVSTGRLKDSVVVTGIHLFRLGDYVVVRAEVDGKWVEVIRERFDGSFSHIVEPGGIRAALEAEGG